MSRYATYSCEDCKEPVSRPVRSDRPKLCIECAVKRSLRNSIALHERAQRGDVEEFREWGRQGQRMRGRKTAAQGTEKRRKETA